MVRISIVLAVILAVSSPVAGDPNCPAVRCVEEDFATDTRKTIMLDGNLHYISIPAGWTLSTFEQPQPYVSPYMLRPRGDRSIAIHLHAEPAESDPKKPVDEVEVHIGYLKRLGRPQGSRDVTTMGTISKEGEFPFPAARGAIEWVNSADLKAANIIVMELSTKTRYRFTINLQSHDLNGAPSMGALKILQSIIPVADPRANARVSLEPARPPVREPTPIAPTATDGVSVELLASTPKQDYFDAWGTGKTVMIIGSHGSYRSADAGKTWTSVLATKRSYRMWASTKEELFVVGAGAYRSTDAGRSFVDLGLKDQALRGVWAHGTRLYVVGEGGLVMRSEDRGATWKRVPVGTAADLNGVWGNKDAVFVAGDNGVIQVSRDDGKTWSTAQTGTALDIWSLSGSGNSVLAAGGKGKEGLLLRGSADGTWSPILLPVKGTVNRVWASSVTDLICIVDATQILRSRDGGRSWAKAGASGDLVYGVSGPTADDLYIVGSGIVRRGKDIQWGVARTCTAGPTGADCN